MIRVKWFLSLYKERDWLEEMARKGYLLNNLTLGIIYHFTECEPCEKVYEVERFAISARPTIAELTAKARALDITSQFGWKQVTHDESMNYYFVKDKAGDETDEFYDTPELRMDRAQRYRQFYSVESSLGLLILLLVMSAFYVLFFYVLGDSPDTQRGLMWLYVILMLVELFILYFNMKMGQTFYQEFLMSRKEWEQYKKYRQKKRFNKVQQLRVYLQEKSENGLALKTYEDGHYIFEEDEDRYNYFVDTKRNMKKRLKQENKTYKDESKDIMFQSLNWYEASIANAAKYGLTPVAVVEKNLLIYKRPFSEEALPWENGNENLRIISPALASLLYLLSCFVLGAVIGVLTAMFL
ncbi:MAG: DUF2812 domain-containing protein [Lachnospiraceae bacterium]|nr:DUF2812 domain-containing protein [Lachnospiraceae bacterium]